MPRKGGFVNSFPPYVHPLQEGATVKRGLPCFLFSHQIPMLWTIAVVLIVLWVLGVVTSYTLGGFIHVLLVFAVIMILIRLIRGERVL